MVNLGRVGFPPPIIQKDQDKTMCISQRYAASGIMNDNVVTTAIMEYEEYEDSDGSLQHLQHGEVRD